MDKIGSPLIAQENVLQQCEVILPACLPWPDKLWEFNQFISTQISRMQTPRWQSLNLRFSTVKLHSRAVLGAGWWCWCTCLMITSELKQQICPQTFLSPTRVIFSKRISSAVAASQKLLLLSYCCQLFLRKTVWM